MSFRHRRCAFLFREVLVDGYRFVCRLEGDVIWVVGVWDGAQLPAEPESQGGLWCGRLTDSVSQR